MIHPLAYPALALFFVLLETTLLAWSLPVFLRPDLVLVLVIFMGLNESLERGALLAWLCGALKDVFAGYFLGLYALVFLASFFGTRMAVRWFNTESALLLVVMAFWGGLAEGVLLVAALALFAESGGSWSLILELLLPQMLATTVATYLLLTLLRWLQTLLGPRFRIPGLTRLDDRHGF